MQKSAWWATILVASGIAGCGGGGADESDAGGDRIDVPEGGGDAGPLDAGDPQDSGADAGVVLPDGGPPPPTCPDEPVVPRPSLDPALCPGVDPAMGAGIVVSEFSVLDPFVPDPSASATFEDFVWTFSPMSFRIRVAAPDLPEGASYTMPLAIGIVPLGSTPSSQAALESSVCVLGTVLLAGVTRAETVHEIPLRDITIGDDCFAPGSPLLTAASRRPAGPEDFAYYTNFGVQPRTCANPDEAGSTPWTFFARSASGPMHPECNAPARRSGDTEAPGLGCVWDVPVVPVGGGNFDVRAAQDGLRAESCVATVWSSAAADAERAPEPLVRSSFSVIAYGDATNELGRTAIPVPLWIEYSIEPSRLVGTGDAGDRLDVSTTELAVGAVGAARINLSDVTLNLPEAHDHLLYLTESTRAKVLGAGAWAADELFTIRACVTDGSSALREVDCASTEVFLDRAAPPEATFPEPPGTLDLSWGECPADGMPWVLGSLSQNFSRGSAGTVLLSLNGISEQTVNRSCARSRNEVIGRVSALNGLLGYDFLDAHANAAGRLTRDPSGSPVASFDGEARVTFFGRDYLGPDRITSSYRPVNRLFMSRMTTCPTFRYFYFVTFSAEFCGQGAWGYDGLEVDWGAVPSASFTEHLEVRELAGRIRPRAMVQVQITGSASALGSVGGVRGTVTLLDIALPVNATARAGLRRDGRGIDAQFQTNVSLAYGGFGSTQIVGFADINYFFGTYRREWALASMPGLATETVPLLTVGATRLYPTY
jgi:hypothetical protein